MKYIKAKIINGETKIYPSDIAKGFLSCVGAKIISEADTIEELCDAYVFVSKSGETHYVYDNFSVENNKKLIKHLLETGTVYGAIWTDKGLIYVAKMNESGELELL